jgi:hypothetical protein
LKNNNNGLSLQTYRIVIFKTWIKCFTESNKSIFRIIIELWDKIYSILLSEQIYYSANSMARVIERQVERLVSRTFGRARVLLYCLRAGGFMLSMNYCILMFGLFLLILLCFYALQYRTKSMNRNISLILNQRIR